MRGSPLNRWGILLDRGGGEPLEIQDLSAYGVVDIPAGESSPGSSQSPAGVLGWGGANMVRKWLPRLGGLCLGPGGGRAAWTSLRMSKAPTSLPPPSGRDHR